MFKRKGMGSLLASFSQAQAKQSAIVLVMTEANEITKIIL